MAKYEASIQGFRKAIDMNITCLEVFGDSQIVIKQVRTSIGYNSYHQKKIPARGMEFDE